MLLNRPQDSNNYAKKQHIAQCLPTFNNRKKNIIRKWHFFSGKSLYCACIKQIILWIK